MKKILVSILVLILASTSWAQVGGNVASQNVIIQEQDGVPKGKLKTLVVPNGSLTYNINGTATVSTAMYDFSSNSFNGTGNFTTTGNVTATNIIGNGSTMTGVLHSEADTLGTVTGRGATTAVASTFSSGIITPKLYPSADSTTAVQINKADGTTPVVNVDTTNGRVGIGTTSPSTILHLAKDSANTSTIQEMLRIATTSTGTVAANFGNSILFQLEDASGNALQDAASISSIWTTPTHGAESSAITFSGVTSGGAITEWGRFTNNGLEIHATADTTKYMQFLCDTGTAKILTSGTGMNFAYDAIGGKFLYKQSDESMFSWVLSKTNDELKAVVRSGCGEALILTDVVSEDDDHDHNSTTNPTLFIHDASRPNISNNKWGSLAHNGAGFVITSGANIGAGTSPETIDNYIAFAPRGTEQARISGVGNLLIGTTDEDGTPATGRLVVKGSTNDGTTNIFVGRDSDEANVATLDTDGNLNVSGKGNIGFPYGSFSSSATQTIAATNAAYAITYTDTENASADVTLSNNSRINIATAGTYLITFSAIGKSAAPNKLLEIWLSKSGTDVPRSNTISKFVGSANERIITVTFIEKFTAGQYFELYMRSDDTGTTLTATAAGTSPTRPASPSIITTVNKISS